MKSVLRLRPVLIEELFVRNCIRNFQITSRAFFFHFQIFHFFSKCWNADRSSYIILHSVKFPKFGNVSCFFFLLRRKEIWGKRCSIRTAPTGKYELRRSLRPAPLFLVTAGVLYCFTVLQMDVSFGTAAPPLWGQTTGI